MENIFGIANFTAGRFGFTKLTPIWNWDWGDSGIVGVALSRRIGALSLWSLQDAFRIEVEAGLGQRFGEQTETEGWIALYGRWTKFPWNDHLYTTVAVSTGLNYASGISAFEIRRSGNGKGSHLLHYLSPEITLALPDHRDTELVLRLHHRSGGGDLFGENGIFNGVTGGAQFAVIGLRSRF